MRSGCPSACLSVRLSVRADLALDLLAAPASQAFVERIFSVCGMLTQGRRNRMTRSLEMRVCLKLNSRVLGQAQADV